jgi:hypothetical protein
MSNCESYVFYLSGNDLRYGEVNVSPQGGLSGCFCVNNACGGSNVLNANLEYVLRAAGGMVVSAFLNDPSMKSFVVSDTKIDINNMSISFYGQDISQCQVQNQGSNDVQNLKTYYQSPGGLSSMGNYYLGNEMKDPNSLGSLVYGAAQLSTGDVKICEITKVFSCTDVGKPTCTCTVGEQTKGDCNVSSSCKVMEESWDGIPIIKGGTKTGLNPVAKPVKDPCNNTWKSVAWITKRTVYVCAKENVFDASQRIEGVTNSTVWDPNTGMVYYNDMIVSNDCKASCPSGYEYNSVSRRCEADPNCPSGSTYDSRKKACVATPKCPNGEQLQVIDQELKCVVEPKCIG